MLSGRPSGLKPQWAIGEAGRLIVSISQMATPMLSRLTFHFCIVIIFLRDSYDENLGYQRRVANHPFFHKAKPLPR